MKIPNPANLTILLTCADSWPPYFQSLVELKLSHQIKCISVDTCEFRASGGNMARLTIGVTDIERVTWQYACHYFAYLVHPSMAYILQH